MTNILPAPPDALLARLRVVLVRTSHPGNIGAAARAMYTMGLARLVLVQPAKFPHPEADALATGAAVVLEHATVAATLDEALAGCALAIGLSARPRAFAGRVMSIREASHEAVARTGDGEVALVFGTEMSGLSNEELAQCQGDLAAANATIASMTADADGDEVPDARDRCADTPAGQFVDDGGCSQAQFCAALPIARKSDRKTCKKLDWKNDEPAMKGKDADCAFSKSANACAAAAP